MKMTEHAQSLNDSAEEVFRDGIVERFMEVILRPYVNGGGTQAVPLTRHEVAARFLFISTTEISLLSMTPSHSRTPCLPVVLVNFGRLRHPCDMSRLITVNICDALIISSKSYTFF